jgi:hypothetical protein
MRQRRTWDPSRQAVRHALRKAVWERLKATDFEGEPVAIRDTQGRPLIRRPAKRVMRDMVRTAFHREFRALAARQRGKAGA